MKIKSTVLLALLVIGLTTFVKSQTSFYDLKSKTIDGQAFDFASLKGKKVLVVNTASKCMYTKQYEELEKLYKTYKDSNFVIIGFPANNFFKQEPAGNKDIHEFCTKNYGVTFQMMEKISVKGDDMDPVYLWLTQQKKNGKMDSFVKWNFQKYMIDETGNLVDVVQPKVSPLDAKIVNWITKK
jgi:glutathione peroxidase